MRTLTRHLKDVDESYIEHLRHASGFAVSMFLGSLACLVHALLPFAFERTGSRCIEGLHDRMVVNRRQLGGRSRFAGNFEPASGEAD